MGLFTASGEAVMRGAIGPDLFFFKGVLGLLSPLVLIIPLVGGRCKVFD